MTLALNKVHEYKRTSDGGPAVLIRSRPVVRLAHEGDPIRVFIQNGVFYTEDGAELPRKMWPSWLATDIAKMNPKVREDVGLKDWKPPEKGPLGVV